MVYLIKVTGWRSRGRTHLGEKVTDNDDLSPLDLEGFLPNFLPYNERSEHKGNNAQKHVN